MFHVEHLDGFGGVIGQKAPSLPDRPGWFLGPSRMKRKNLWSAASQRQYRRKKKFHVEHWMVLCRKSDKRPPPCQTGRAGFLDRAGGKEKTFGLLQAKGNTEEKKFHVEHWKVLCRKLDKRPPPCQKGRADCFGRAEGKKISLWPTASQRHDR